MTVIGPWPYPNRHIAPGTGVPMPGGPPLPDYPIKPPGPPWDRPPWPQPVPPPEGGTPPWPSPGPHPPIKPPGPGGNVGGATPGPGFPQPPDRPWPQFPPVPMPSPDGPQRPAGMPQDWEFDMWGGRDTAGQLMDLAGQYGYEVPQYYEGYGGQDVWNAYSHLMGMGEKFPGFGDIQLPWMQPPAPPEQPPWDFPGGNGPVFPNLPNPFPDFPGGGYPGPAFPSWPGGMLGDAVESSRGNPVDSWSEADRNAYLQHQGSMSAWNKSLVGAGIELRHESTMSDGPSHLPSFIPRSYLTPDGQQFTDENMPWGDYGLEARPEDFDWAGAMQRSRGIPNSGGRILPPGPVGLPSPGPTTRPTPPGIVPPSGTPEFQDWLQENHPPQPPPLTKPVIDGTLGPPTPPGGWPWEQPPHPEPPPWPFGDGGWPGGGWPGGGMGGWDGMIATQPPPPGGIQIAPPGQRQDPRPLFGPPNQPFTVAPTFDGRQRAVSMDGRPYPQTPAWLR